MIAHKLLALGLLACLTSDFGRHAPDTRRPNVLLICVDDLRPELKSFGVDYMHTPHIDGLAARGRAFHRHYVQAPTCGASRFSLLTGRYGGNNNGALFRRAAQIAKKPNSVPPSMPAYFRKNGYTTVSVGKVSHHPGGRGGPNWNDEKKPEMPESWDRHLLPAGPWKHPRGAMHGLANGEIRKKSKDMALFQTVDGPDSVYPDGLIVDEALAQLDALAREDKPFFLATGIIRPHLPFGAPAKYMEPYADAKLPPIPHPTKPAGKTTWHKSGEFMKYKRWKRNPNEDAAFATEVRKHYAACVTYADALIGRLLAKLEELELTDDTIVVVWGDHGWHLGEHAIWGKHSLFEESLRSPLIVVAPQVEKPGTPTTSIVETLDIFPTLCALAGLEVPAHARGKSLVPFLANPAAPGHVAISYRGAARTIRSDRWRLITHKNGHAELYDHASDERETKNVAADHPEVVEKLRAQLAARLER